MVIPDESETSQTEGEGPDSSDKPPHEHTAPQRSTTIRSHNHHLPPNKLQLDTINARLSGDTLTMTNNTSVSIPLPSPETGAYPKEPGHTRAALEKLVLSNPPQGSISTLGSGPPSVDESSSPSDTESTVSTRPPSQAPSRPSSRAPSVSAGVSGGKVAPLATKTPAKKERTIKAEVKPRSRASSTHSNEGNHKFNLKDLLSGGPKLARKASTGSSKKSDSDNGDAKSNAGSTASLSQKYGVCQKLAIGKGATSVVRLAHKWDRSEEKLYAVKVCLALVSIVPPFFPILIVCRSSASGERTNRKRNTSRSLQQSFVFRRPCTTSIL